MNRFEKSLGFIVAVLLCGCASAVSPQWGNADEAAPQMAAARPQLSPKGELMYRILAAEIAGKRGQLDTALKYYLEAAEASDDPRLAERAVGIALYMEKDDALLQAARRWYALDPGKLQPRQALALGLLRSKHVDEALGHLEAVLAAASDDGQEGFATLNALLAQVADKGTVLQVMQSLRARHPRSLFALYYYSLAALNSEDFERAQEGLDTALAQDPKWVPAHLLRARLMMKMGDTDGALNNLAKAVAALPKDAVLRTGYARLLIGADRMDEARRQFEVLAEQNPKDSESLLALGLLAAQAHDFDKAVSYFMQVLRQGTRVMDVYYELGKVEEMRGDYVKARDWYARVVSGERYISAQIRMGAMLGHLNRFQAMEDHFATLRRDNPQSAIPLYLTQADILRDQNRFKMAFDLLSQALDQYPANQDLLYARALAAEKIDRLDILEQDLRALIKANPDNAHALNALGYTLADRTERYEEALGYLRRAIALLPEDPAVLDSMGWIQYRLGRYEESLNYLRRAYKLNADAEIAAHLSEVLWVSGRQDEARRIWQGAMEQHPENTRLVRVKERFGL